MNFPAIADAMLDKVEYDAIDDPDLSRSPGADRNHHVHRKRTRSYLRGEL